MLTRAEWGLIGIGLALRLWVCFAWVRPEDLLVADMGEYHRNAIAIAFGQPERVRTVLPLGFSIVAAPLLRLELGWTFVKLAQCVLGSAAVAFAALAARLAFGRVAGLITLAVLALHVPWIVYTGVFMPETLHACLVCLFLWLAGRGANSSTARGQFWLGAELLCALFVKGLSGLLVPIWWLYTVAARSTPGSARLRRGLAFAGGVAVAAGLALALTAKVVGRPVLLADASGLNFVEGKCPAKLNVDSTGMYAHSPLFLQQGLVQRRDWPRPFTEAPYFFGEGLKCIAADPLVLLTSVRYVAFLFMGNVDWPANLTALRTLNRRYEAVFDAWLVVFGAIGLFVLRRRLLEPSVAPFTLAIASLFLTVWIFKSEMRYRVPFDGAFVALASVGLVASWQRLRSRQSGSAGALPVPPPA